MRIIQTQHGHTEKREVMEKLQKGSLQLVETALVGIQMIPVDIGDQRNHRLQLQERAVAFIRLGHQVATFSQARTRTERVDHSANDKGRVQPRLGEDAGNQ